MSERKVAIVTGGAKGIGAATVDVFKRRGWHVASLDVSFDQSASMTGVTDVIEIETNVTHQQSVDSAVKQALDHFGQVDALVNNAGIQRWSLISDMEPATWHEVMLTNFFGGLYCIQAVCEHMINRRSGSIVNVLSVMAERGAPNRGPYSSSKAALQALTRTAAVEFGPKGIRVNAVGPGYVETPLMAEYFETKRVDKSAIEASVPLRRVGIPDEIAKAIEFLASDDSSYVNGHTLFVDGGLIVDSGIK